MPTNRRHISLGNFAPLSVFPNHTVLIPLIAVSFAEVFCELIQSLGQYLSLTSYNSVVFAHLYWSFWKCVVEYLVRGIPVLVTLVTRFLILLVWLIIRSLAILPSAYPGPPGRRVFSILLLSILQIDGRMFSHSSSVPMLDYPGLTFLTATSLFN